MQLLLTDNLAKGMKVLLLTLAYFATTSIDAVMADVVKVDEKIAVLSKSLLDAKKGLSESISFEMDRGSDTKVIELVFSETEVARGITRVASSCSCAEILQFNRNEVGHIKSIVVKANLIGKNRGQSKFLLGDIKGNMTTFTFNISKKATVEFKRTGIERIGWGEGVLELAIRVPFIIRKSDGLKLGLNNAKGYKIEDLGYEVTHVGKSESEITFKTKLTSLGERERFYPEFFIEYKEKNYTIYGMKAFDFDPDFFTREITINLNDWEGEVDFSFSYPSHGGELKKIVINDLDIKFVATEEGTTRRVKFTKTISKQELKSGIVRGEGVFADGNKVPFMYYLLEW